MRELPGRIKRVLKNFGIADKVDFATTDNGASVVKAFNYLERDGINVQHILCLADIWYPMVTDGLCFCKQNLGGEDVGELDQDAAELGGDVVINENDLSGR